MKKVTLLGDSIRLIGYGAKVAEMLKGEYEVFQPEENCRFVKYTLRMLFDYREQIGGSDVIHWNNGHWDICDLFGDGTFSTEDEYVENMLHIADILLKRHKTVIFATTTPVLDTNPYNTNSMTDRFNSIIVPKLEEKGIIINDLNLLLRNDIERYICSDMIHLTDEGTELFAKQVAEYITNTAKVMK